MKILNLITLALVAALFGAGSGLSRTVYVLVGLSAAWQIRPLFAGAATGEVSAERG